MRFPSSSTPAPADTCSLPGSCMYPHPALARSSPAAGALHGPERSAPCAGPGEPGRCSRHLKLHPQGQRALQWAG